MVGWGSGQSHSDAQCIYWVKSWKDCRAGLWVAESAPHWGSEIVDRVAGLGSFIWSGYDGGGCWELLPGIWGNTWEQDSSKLTYFCLWSSSRLINLGPEAQLVSLFLLLLMFHYSPSLAFGF